MKINGSNKKIYVLIVLVIIGIVVFTFGLTYSFWQYTNTQTGENVVNTECLSIDFTGENDIDIPNAYPMEGEELESFLASETPYHFTITNNCNSQASATINLESLDAEAERQLADEWVGAILYETDYHNKLNKATQLTANPLNDANKVIKESLHAYSLANITLKANDVKNYYLLLYMDEKTPLNEETQNATWKGKITLSAEYKYDQFVNSGTIRKIASSDIKGMWGYKDRLTKIVIETKKSEKTGSEGQTVYGPFNEGVSENAKAVQSYVVCDTEYTNCIGYLQGDGGIKLNSDSRGLFYDFKKVTKIEGIENLDTRGVTNMQSMFGYMSSLEELDLSNFDTSSATTMIQMFYRMSTIQELDLSSFNTNKVTEMYDMFNGMSNIQELDLSTFDTSSVTNMVGMFREMSNLETLTFGENFDTSRVTSMSAMFYGVSNLQTLDLSSFNTNKVTEMYDMFNGMSNIQELDLSTFDTSSVTNMVGMFREMSNLETLTFGENFDTSRVTSMGAMFYGVSNLQTLDLSNFNTTSVTNMQNMFREASKLSKITYGPNFIHNGEADTSWMFSGCPANKPNKDVHPSWEGVF